MTDKHRHRWTPRRNPTRTFDSVYDCDCGAVAMAGEVLASTDAGQKIAAAGSDPT